MSRTTLTQLLEDAERRVHRDVVREALGAAAGPTTLGTLRALFAEQGLTAAFEAMTLAQVADALAPPPAPAPAERPRFVQDDEPAIKRPSWTARSRVEREDIASQVLGLLAGAPGPVTRAELVNALDIQDADARVALRDLAKQGYVKKEGAGRGARYGMG